MIAYASWSLGTAECNYTTTEIECLAAVRAMKHFRPYLFMQPFDLVTDHSALTWLMSYQNPSRRVNRWLIALADYSYRIVYQKGKKHQNADALSRIPKQEA